EAAVEALREINAQLRIAMLCSGAADLAALRTTPLQRSGA
ncbi:type 2 isopentenyl-diphosphate Delta-isomerase, partial [bacterium]|nr:type 2 isopentenyl-diphosphate Delta-isomerase [bacterium]